MVLMVAGHLEVRSTLPTPAEGSHSSHQTSQQEIVQARLSGQSATRAELKQLPTFLSYTSTSLFLSAQILLMPNCPVSFPPSVQINSLSYISFPHRFCHFESQLMDKKNIKEMAESRLNSFKKYE